LILLALVNSMLGVANAAVAAAGRVAFAMGRTGVLPSALGRTHATFRTPHIAIATVTVAGAVAALVAGSIWDLLTAASTLAIAVAVPALVIYVVVCVATIVAYRGPYRSDFSVWLHVLVPVAAVALLLAPIYYQYVPFPPEPLGYANWFAAIWLALGIGVVVWLFIARRDALERTRLFFEDPERAG
jgi:amino acid transporter